MEPAEEKAFKSIAMLKTFIESDDKDAIEKVAAMSKAVPLITHAFDVAVLNQAGASLMGAMANPTANRDLYAEVMKQLEKIQNSDELMPEITDELMISSLLSLSTSYYSQILDAVREGEALDFVTTVQAAWIEGYIFRGLLDAETVRRTEQPEG